MFVINTVLFIRIILFVHIFISNLLNVKFTKNKQCCCLVIGKSVKSIIKVCTMYVLPTSFVQDHHRIINIFVSDYVIWIIPLWNENK